MTRGLTLFGDYLFRIEPFAWPSFCFQEVRSYFYIVTTVIRSRTFCYRSFEAIRRKDWSRYIKITMKYRRQEAWSSTCEKGGVFLENVCQFYHRTKFVRLLRIYCIFACFTYGINYDMGKELVTGRGFYFLPTGNRFDGHDNEKSRPTNFSVF